MAVGGETGAGEGTLQRLRGVTASFEELFISPVLRSAQRYSNTNTRHTGFSLRNEQGSQVGEPSHRAGRFGDEALVAMKGPENMRVFVIRHLIFISTLPIKKPF